MNRPEFQLNFLLPRYWPTWIGLALLRLLILLPLRWQYRIGSLLGKIGYNLMPRRRHITQVNLQLCFPKLSDAQREQLTKASFRSVGIGVLETATAWWGSDSKIQGPNKSSLLVLEDYHHYLAAQQANKGVILSGAHFTTLDLYGRMLSKNHKISCIYREAKNKLVDYFMYRGRIKYYHQLLHRDDIRGILRALRAGESIWYAPDQDYGRERSVFTEFFGVTAATITATSRLAKLTGAKVVPGFQYRDESTGLYMGYYFPALENFPTDNEVADAKRINEYVEQAILRAPEQYLWQHRRFKTRPDGEPRPYESRG